MTTHDSSLSVQHPVQAGPGAATWYSLAESTHILRRGILVLILAQSMLWWDHSRFDEQLGSLLVAAIVSIAVLAVIDRQSRRAAWAEVPGAWAWRFSARGDSIGRREAGWPETVWLIARGWSWVAGGVFLATLDVSAATRFTVLGGGGAYYLGCVVGIGLTQVVSRTTDQRWASRVGGLSVFESFSWIIIGVVLAMATMSAALLPLLSAVLIVVAVISVVVGVCFGMLS